MGTTAKKFGRTRGGRKWHRLDANLVNGVQFSICGRYLQKPEDWHSHRDHVDNAHRCAFCEQAALVDE